MSELNIEVEAFWGDNDTHDELHLIGPFPTEAAMEQAWHKLKALPGNHGDARFSYCHKPMAAADNMVDLSEATGQPDRLDRINTFDELLDAFEYGPGGS